MARTPPSDEPQRCAIEWKQRSDVLRLVKNTHRDRLCSDSKRSPASQLSLVECPVGAVDWIDKPIAHAELGDAITRHIDRGPGGILIVEDDPDARELLRRYVADEHAGTLRVANDGASALNMLTHHLPDLIVLDLKMPYIDGFASLETIHADERLRELPVIVVTAAQLTPEQRTMLLGRTIAVLEKGTTLESDLARVLRRIPRLPKAVPHLILA